MAASKHAGPAKPRAAGKATKTATRAEASERMLLLSQVFGAWLATNDCSLALTTYQAGRLVMIGRRPDGSVRAH